MSVSALPSNAQDLPGAISKVPGAAHHLHVFTLKEAAALRTLRCQLSSQSPTSPADTAWLNNTAVVFDPPDAGFDQASQLETEFFREGVLDAQFLDGQIALGHDVLAGHTGFESLQLQVISTFPKLCS